MKREPFKIKARLHQLKIKMIEIASTLGVSNSIISETIYGKRNHRQTLAYLLRKGVAPRDLGLTKDEAQKILASFAEAA